MAKDDFTTSPVERELITAFRLMEPEMRRMHLRVAQGFASKELAKRNANKLQEGNKSKIRLVASAGQLLAR